MLGLLLFSFYSKNLCLTLSPPGFPLWGMSLGSCFSPSDGLGIFSLLCLNSSSYSYIIYYLSLSISSYSLNSSPKFLLLLFPFLPHPSFSSLFSNSFNSAIYPKISSISSLSSSGIESFAHKSSPWFNNLSKKSY